MFTEKKYLSIFFFYLSILVLLQCPALTAGKKDKLKDKNFIVTPYLQLGNNFEKNSLALCWVANRNNSNEWLVETEITKSNKNAKDSNQLNWQSANKITQNKINGHAENYLYTAEIALNNSDNSAQYRVKLGNEILFQSIIPALPKKGQKANFIVFGDCGYGSSGQAKLAKQIKSNIAPLCVITGDIVYPTGTFSNYLRHFFPYYNSEGGKASGSLIMDKKIFAACPGNHDLTLGAGQDARDLDLLPDSMSYYVLFKEPLNGPLKEIGPYVPQVRGNKLNIDSFKEAAGASYPCMSNYSFSYGDIHWLILDGNLYMDWTNSQLRQWVEKDLLHSNSKFKFVAFHQPGFHSDPHHREEQRMRELSDIFEKCGVDICFSGHSHSYQRSFPLYFKKTQINSNDPESKLGFVFGNFKLDKSYDGLKNTKPKGVIYVVSGAGGAHLANPLLEDDPTEWLPFTAKLFCKNYSYTSGTLENDKLTIEQINEDGQIIDKFEITKK